jgi:hypothetical protein
MKTKQTKQTKVTYKQLYNFCSKNIRKTFVMNSPSNCILAQFAQKELKIKPIHRVAFCEFTSLDDSFKNRGIRFNGEETVTFPQLFVDAVYNLAHDYDSVKQTGYSLALLINRLAKKRF